MFKPWPNGVASERKLGNVNLRAQTCDGRPNGVARRRKFSAISKKAISVQPCTCARTKENNTETGLCWVAKRWKTCVDTCMQILARSTWTKVIASHRKYTQVMATRSRKLMQLSFQLAITCDSISARALHWVGWAEKRNNFSLNPQT